MIQLTLILDNVRSSHNVGALLRTADAVGVGLVICCGITPYPRLSDDRRDPVVVNRNTRDIAKTALGAEQTILVEHQRDTTTAMLQMRDESRTIYGLEQSPRATNILTTKLMAPSTLVVGNEVDGLSAAVLDACDQLLEIPQSGGKESLNVAVAAGVALYAFFGQSVS